MNKEEVRQYWRRKERETFLKVFCLSLIGTAILIVGCGETAEEINANNAKSRAAVEADSANNNIKSTGSVIAKKVGGSATIILPVIAHDKMSSGLNIPNEEAACINTNETVDELKEQEKLIKAVTAELDEWLCSGDTDYLYKAMAVIRAEIDNELQHEIDKLIADREG